jgi:hypothetical protein
VKLYALAIEGNHIHGPALFPEANRAHFMRDLNSCVARAVARHTKEYPGGRLWGRRYSCEYLPGAEDVERYFFYTVLQPVQDGLVEKISDYPGYNCFHDAVHGIKRKFKVMRWAEFNAARRFNPAVSPKDYEDWVSLEYARLPGFEDMEAGEYSKYMHEKLEDYRQQILEERRKAGLGFLGKTAMLQLRRGCRPVSSKVSDINSDRPRVLAKCPVRRKQTEDWYFGVFFDYSEASERYRSGEADVEFPEGTYKPYLAVACGRDDPLAA